MGYLELKKEINEINSSIFNLKSDIMESENKVKGKEEEVRSLKSDRGENVEKARVKALADFEMEVCSPYRDKENELQQLKIKLKNKQEELLRANTPERYEEKYKEEFSIEDTKKSIEGLKDSASKFYGGECYGNIKNYVCRDLNFENELSDSNTLVERLNQINSLEDKKPDGVLDKIFELLNGIEYSKENPIDVVVPAIILLVCVIVGFKFYPIIVIGLGLVIAYNFYKSSLTLKCTSIVESFDSNEKLIEKNLKDYVDNCIRKKEEEIKSDYKNTVNVVEKQILNNENSMELELAKRREEFSFDSSEIESEFDLRVKNVEQSIQMSNEIIMDKKASLSKLESDLEAKQEELRTTLTNLKDEFLPKELQPSMKFPEEFLFSNVGDKPVIKKIPYEGALFLYDSDEVGNDFMTLLFYQINSRVKPTMIRNIYFDTINLGSNLIACSKLDNMEIIIKNDDWKNQVSELNNQLSSRMITMSEFDNIDKYNEFMLSQDSVPETKFFIYSKVEDDLKNVMEPDNLSVIRNGFKFGFTEFIFAKCSKGMKDLSSDFLEIINNIGCCYYVSEDSLKKLSKEFIKTKISQ